MVAGMLEQQKMNDVKEREVIITRSLNAPRELVFEVWSRPEHVGAWFGPKGFRTETKSMDFRPGGAWVFTMTGPDDVVYPNHVTYETIEHPSRITYQHGSAAGDEHAFHVTVTFEERNGKTDVTLRSLFPTREARDYVVREFGAIERGKETLAKLDELTSHMKHVLGSIWTLPTDTQIVMTRVFDAPRALVYKAWTDPDQVKQWWGPNQFTTPRVTIDLRKGGEFKYVMVGPDGAEYPNRAEYVEIVPNEKLVYMDNFDMPNPPFESLHVEVVFEDFAGKTRLTVRTTTQSVKDRDTLLNFGSQEGWSQQMEKLDTFLAT